MFENHQKEKGIHSLTSLHKGMGITIAVCFVTLIINGYLYSRVSSLQTEYDEIKQTSEQSQEANEKVLAMLKEIRDEQKKQNDVQEKIMGIKMEQAEHRYTIRLLKSNGMSVYSDIGQNNDLTVDDMNKIIDYYDSKIKGGTPFKGKGEAFIRASKETGLNPVYLFAHAACESGFGNSYLARTRGNYFGINAVDNDPGKASVMGNSVDQGIVSGAHWIKSNFYDNGYKTLDSMKKAGYASDQTWDTSISKIANDAIQIL